MCRPDIDEYFLGLAHLVSSRSTYVRRKVGAVAVSKENYIISTGYNGVPAGAPHCTDKPCLGSKFGSGDKLDVCESIHAEVNAIAHCHNPQEITTIYLTTSPCMSCMKLIVSTGCRRVIVSEVYDHDACKYFKDIGGRIELNDTLLKQLK